MHGDERFAVRHNLLTLGETTPGFLCVGSWLHFIKKKKPRIQKPKQISPLLAGAQPIFPSLPPDSLFTVPTERYRLMPSVQLHYIYHKLSSSFFTSTFKRRIKSHLPFAGIIRSSPYSPRFQDKG